jgi:hypothetical protein
MVPLGGMVSVTCLILTVPDVSRVMPPCVVVLGPVSAGLVPRVPHCPPPPSLCPALDPSFVLGVGFLRVLYGVLSLSRGLQLLGQLTSQILVIFLAARLVYALRVFDDRLTNLGQGI